MIKRTIFISNPYRLTLKDNQLQISERGGIPVGSAPVEDLGFLVLDHPQISFSMKLIEILNTNNVAVIFCDSKHMPSSMLLGLENHSIQTELFRAQIKASEPLKKNLWKQTIEAKIKNQAALLKKFGYKSHELMSYAKSINSGDTGNREGLAARIYWPRIFGKGFRRERFGTPPNIMLNYGYILLRSAVARALSGSGLLPTLGIHHRNRYNAFCLADDMMEPYRPFVDEIVIELNECYPDCIELSKEIKARLLKLMAVDVPIGDSKRPLMIALSQTTASLSRCFSGEVRKITYPEFN